MLLEGNRSIVARPIVPRSVAGRGRRRMGGVSRCMNTSAGVEHLASYRRCVWRVRSAWPAFRQARALRSEQGRRHQPADSVEGADIPLTKQICRERPDTTRAGVRARWARPSRVLALAATRGAPGTVGRTGPRRAWGMVRLRTGERVQAVPPPPRGEAAPWLPRRGVVPRRDAARVGEPVLSVETWIRRQESVSLVRLGGTYRCSELRQAGSRDSAPGDETPAWAQRKVWRDARGCRVEAATLQTVGEGGRRAVQAIGARSDAPVTEAEGPGPNALSPREGGDPAGGRPMPLP